MRQRVAEAMRDPSARCGDHAPIEASHRGRRRFAGDRGTAIITASVLLFTLTAGGIVYLTRDVNRVITNRSAAQSIAFQAARAGAQQLDLESLRNGESTGIVIDVQRARAATSRVAAELFAAYGLDGSVSSPEIDGDTVTVSVTVTDDAGTQSATASVQAQVGP